MNDVDRWINLEGPPPPGIRELLDAARAAPRVEPVPELSPELAEELDRLVAVAIAAEDARWARERRMKVGLTVLALVAAALGALVLVLRAQVPVAVSVAADVPGAVVLGAAKSEGLESAVPPAAPSASVSARAPLPAPAPSAPRRPAPLPR